jgi:hypothetical protein
MIIDALIDGINITCENNFILNSKSSVTQGQLINNECIFKFIEDPQKKMLLTAANEILHINKSKHNKIIFVYSAPKVGSTSIVSSLRLFGIDKFCVVHIHDEEMLKVIGNISGITINEIILFNKYLGKDVYVIDVFRCPIERKISAYFEKVGVYHFNNYDEKVNKYNVKRIINRFNKIFPHIGNDDNFIDKYNISIPEHFNWENKYLQIEENGITYLKLRLRDSEFWGDILSSLLKTKICIVKDYETSKKTIKDLYAKFKANYKIPKNFLNDIINSYHVNYFFSPNEKAEYYAKWLQKSADNFVAYTRDEYKMYQEITLENSHLDFIQRDHYIDEGCICKACCVKRILVVSKIISGIDINFRVTHDIAKQELLKRRIDKINILNHSFKNQTANSNSGKDFKTDMKDVVTGKFKY